MDIHGKTQLTDVQYKTSVQSGDTRVLAQTADVGQINAEDDQKKQKGETWEDGCDLGKRLSDSKEDTAAEEALTESNQQGMEKDSIKVQTRIDPICGYNSMSQGNKADLEKKVCDIHLRQGEEDTEEDMVAVVSLALENEGWSNVSDKNVIKQLSDTKQSADKNGNVSEGEVVHATNLPEMQSHDVKRESSGMMSGESDTLKPTHHPVNERLIHDGQGKEEKLSCGIEDEECHKESSHTTSWVTVRSVNNNGQESGDFKNSLPGICEGQGVESQGLNHPPCGEAKRGFPEGNNEQWQDENTMQSFQEETIYPAECQTVVLPEEMEGKQSIRNNGFSTGSEDLLLTEHMEEEHKTKEDIQESSDFPAEDYHGILHLTDAALPQGEGDRGPGLPEDFGECGLVRQEIGTKSTSLEEDPKEMQDPALNMEKLVHKDKVEDEMALKESKNENEKEISKVVVASMSESNKDSSKSWAVESELPVTEKQQLKATITDTISKSTAKDRTEISAVEPQNGMPMIYMDDTSLNSAEDVTVDPLTQTLLSQDTDCIKQQEESEARPQMDLKAESANDEEDESSSHLIGSEEQCVVQSRSGGFEFRSEEGMSSCPDESTFLEDDPCRSGANKGGSLLWTQVTGSLDSTFSNISESLECFIPGPSTETLDIVMEETTEVQQSGHLKQESMESRGNFNQESASQSVVGVTDHPVETKHEIHKEEIHFSTEMDTFALVAKKNEDTPTNSEYDVEDAELGVCRSPSKVSLQEEKVSIGCKSEGVIQPERLLKLSFMVTPGDVWSADDVDAQQDDTQVTANLTEGSRDPMQVLFHRQYIYITNHL